MCLKRSSTRRCGRAVKASAWNVLGATRRNPVLRAFYARLLIADKKPKVALTACRRKLLIMLTAIPRQQLQWDPEFASALPLYLQVSNDLSKSGCDKTVPPQGFQDRGQRLVVTPGHKAHRPNSRPG